MLGSSLSLGLVLSFLVLSSDGFVTPTAFTPGMFSPGHSHTTFVETRSLLHMAKKKRRRRKGSSSSSPQNPPPVEGTSGVSPSDELPEFDFDDGTVESSPVGRAPIDRPGPAKPIGEVTVDDLLSDRSLESKMQFDEEEMDLPDLSDFRNPQSAVQIEEPVIGKKRARAEARRAAAIAEQDKEESNIFSSLPFIGDALGGGEDGKLEPLKILETGAWIGIFMLIAWEVYINSPFFERAAPMAPVVY